MVFDRGAEEATRAGIAEANAGRFEASIIHFEQAYRLAPHETHTLSNLSAAYTECGRFEEALAVLEKLLIADPNYADAHHNQSIALRGLGRYAEAIKASRTALASRPNQPGYLTSLALSLYAEGDFHSARDACEQAMSKGGRSAIAAVLLGKIHSRLGDTEQALHWFHQASLIDPNLGEPYLFAGDILRRNGRIADAIHCFSVAATKEDQPAQASVRLGDTQSAIKDYDAAIASYERAIEADSSLAFAEVQRLHLLAWQCEWATIEESRERIPSLGVETSPVSPFALLGFEDAPERHRVRSERFAAENFRTTPPVAIARTATDRLRVGYFSNDFYGHATAFLAARMFELHDRTAFEVHAYNYGVPRTDDMANRLREAFDGFHEVGSLSDASAARLARDHSIDIAVDLKGYTEGQRLGILASRPAPVQVTFLGYPGTTGAGFIDFLVADPHVIPPEERGHYSEKLIVLPDCYQPTDNQRRVGKRGSRRDAGLPDDGFVFASFNHSWKITAEAFDRWTEILRQVDGSVLWLLKSNETAERNLRNCVEQSGLDPARLIFAPFLPQNQHLGRLGHADLFLDTFPYCAHTTASDALWAGVPVVTLAGRGFATRVATSILRAAALGDLVAESRDSFINLAVSIARDSETMATLRQRLTTSVRIAPLFDSARFTKAFEVGLCQAYDQTMSGHEATDIRVEAPSE